MIMYDTAVDYAYELAEDDYSVQEITDMLYDRYDPYITYDDAYDIAIQAVEDTEFTDRVYWGLVWRALVEEDGH